MRLRSVTIVVAALMWGLGLTGLASSDAARQTGGAKPDAAALYKANCQMCHGVDGKSALKEMAFVERKKWKHGTKSSEMVNTITNGVAGTPMLPFKAKLSPAEIQALARYVRAFDKRLPPEK